MKTNKVVVNYGTIKSMEVELPAEGYNCIELLKAWVSGFIKYMTENSVVSDDVLISSIGKSHAHEALILGIKERINDNDKMRNTFLNHVSDNNWRFEVIRQRRGIEAAIIDMHGEEIGKKLIELTANGSAK